MIAFQPEKRACDPQKCVRSMFSSVTYVRGVDFRNTYVEPVLSAQFFVVDASLPPTLHKAEYK